MLAKSNTLKKVVSFISILVMLVSPFLIAKPGLAATPKINHGIISYAGAELTSTSGYIPFYQIVENWHLNNSCWPGAYKTAVEEDFSDIRNRFGAKSVRIIIHPWLKGWTNPCTGEDYGFTFPNPTAQEKSNLGAVIDAAYNKGLQVFIVMVLPTEYLYLHPDEIDDVEYAKNNQSLVYNLYTFWNNIFGSVLSARMNKISYVDIMGDFDPLNIWGRFSSQQLEYHREWWRRIWPNFYAWYSYIPSSKKVFELVGGPHNPKNLTRDEINWVRNEINSRGWPEPSRYSIEAYVNRKWLDDNYPNNWYGGYHAIFSTAASAAGGWNKLLIEELGSNHYPGADTNDGAEGDRMFSASMAVIANFAPDVPFGIWNYYDRTAPHDQTHSFMGLYKAGNVLTIGWYVLPLNFCGQVPC